MRLAALHNHGTYSSHYFNLFQQKQQLPDMEFGRRMATERDLEKTNSLKFSNVGNELESKWRVVIEVALAVAVVAIAVVAVTAAAVGTLRSTTAKLWYGGCNRKRLGRLRRLAPKLELIKFCVVRQSQTRCKQIRLGSKFFGCGMFI